MNSSKWSPMLMFSLLILISIISAIDSNIRNKRAPPSNNQANGVTPRSPSAAQPLLVKPANKAEGNGVKPKKIEHFKIAETPECAEDVNRFCSDKINSNNLLVLDCLQDNEKIISKLSEGCHHTLWEYKLKLTRDSRFEDASSQACAHELDNFPGCKSLDRGEVIPCLIEHYEDVKSKPCSQFLTKMASIIFSDYRLMNFFMKDCKEDITALSCGRIDALDKEDDTPHSQGNTVACLNKHRKSLNKACKKSLFRVAELQSEDFHLDRPLYYACRGDRDHLCHDVVAGDGAVFKCLYKHLGDDRLSHECRMELERRQELIAEDVKVDGSFYVDCKEDIRINDCAKDSRDESGEKHFDRSSILLCLEEAQSKKKDLRPECLQEMFDLRAMLMQDYKVSPELVNACEEEIKNSCPLIESANVLQCLMKVVAHSKQNKGKHLVSSECKAEVIKLVEVVNPGEDIRLDAPLMRVCGDVVDHACSEYHAGQGDLMTCLLENLDHEDMTDECEDELLVVQYFAARNFRLDFHLFKQCRTDAITLCHSNGFSDPSTMKSDESSLIFSCLHRHMRSNDLADAKPARPCIHEIKRVMRERSFKINLMPEVEEACLEDLASHCSDEDEHNTYGGEMECLQSALDSLTDKCKIAVANFTQEAAEVIELDRTFMRACRSMFKVFCSDLLDSDDIRPEAIDCLIEHKNNNGMQEKCAASIEHHQIISLKDFKFNVKFHSACDHSAKLYCKAKTTKYDVLTCLSELVRNDTINDAVHRVDDRCRHQLKFELLQRGESLNLDPELKKSCEPEIHDFCRNRKSGEGEIVECLRANKGRLSDVCYQVLFQREKDDALFGDYSLLHVCKDTIENFCSASTDEADILRCLIENKDHFQNFDDRCRQLVQSRQIEQSQDIELNPHLQKACKLDIPKFCADVYHDRAHKGKAREGRVIDCLKKTYASPTKVLTEDCKREILFRIQESAVDINLNPVLLKICKSDIKQFCLDNIAMLRNEDVNGSLIYSVFGSGTIMECLKKHFQSLKALKCKQEVAYAVAESRVDLNVDPILHTACQQDVVTHCKGVQEGQGRHMSCLLSYLANNPTALTRNCKQLLQNRKDLWQSAAQVAPAESFSEILDQMSSSPARNYFFAILFTVIGVIFIVGLTCGRVTKRVRAEIKNK